MSPSTPTATDAVTAGRQAIDEVDAEIVRLIRRRADVSRGVQQARMATGGRRVEHSREVEVVQHYSDALGRAGTRVALTLLEICRGRS
jgi:chorismate mutase